MPQIASAQASDMTANWKTFVTLAASDRDT